MNLDYTKVTHEQLLDQFRNRLLSDPRFKNLSAAAIFQLYMEMMTGTFDMLHFYLGRTAEEMFLDSAKLDSSIIKLAKNLGYNPKRAIPATAEIAIKLSGPLPKAATIGDTIWFNNEALKLSFNNKPYRLDYCYSYTFNADDIMNGVNNPNWSKTIRFSKPREALNGMIPLVTEKDALSRIKVVQCSIITEEIYAVAHAENIGESYQYYDINNIKFSNYYGKRDPYAYFEDEYMPENGWCKIGIGLNKTDAFSTEKLCDIEIENVHCNPKVKAANYDLNQTKKLNVCRVESNQDKTIRITFGDGNIVNNGFNNEDEILYVQYVETDGYAANTPDVIGYTLDNTAKLMAHAPGKLYDVTKNVSFVLTTNISNGDDFESAQRLKNSAAVYFASRGQLINKKDFNDYFSSMSRPIHAKNAVAWNAIELRATTTKTSYNNIVEAKCDRVKDAVFYTVIGDLYESLGNDKYKVKELYTTEDDSIVGTTTLYNTTNDFLNHIADLAMCVTNTTGDSTFQNIVTNQTTDRTKPFYLNTSTIYNDIEEKLQFGVVPISIPPIVQYFDLVGNVEIDRTVNVADYSAAVESKIYKWLVDRQKFNNKIYKSDIIKLIYENAATKSVNVDITPSSLTTDGGNCYVFEVQSGVTDDVNYAYIASAGQYQNNVVVLKRVSDNAILNNSSTITGTGSDTVSALMSKALIESAITIGFTITTDKYTKPVKFNDVTVKQVQELPDGRVQIILNDLNYTNLQVPSTIDTKYLWLKIDNAESHYYKPGDNASSVVNYLIGMMNSPNDKSDRNATTETAVALPYKAELRSSNSNATYERLVDFYRNENKRSAYKINEKTFNFNWYSSNVSLADYQEAYPAVKYIIEDSILDDNNNIVNYTLPNEISVVRVKLNYTYGR